MAAAADIDFESARLAVHLERNDTLEDLNRSLNPNLTAAQEGGLRSRLLAIESHDVELQLAGSRYAGQRVQQSMYRAMLADNREIAANRREEQQSVEDRAEAARLSGRAAPPIPELVRQQQQGAEYENERLAEIEETINNADEGDLQSGSTVAGASDIGSEPTLINEGSSQPVPNLEQYMTALQIDEADERVECVVCTELRPTARTVTLACEHTWCRNCMTTQFEEATRNEGAWPPKCCRQDISLAQVGPLLMAGIRARFAAKSIEWATVNRTYCHNTACASFIPPAAIEDRRGLCQTCTSETCTECKGAFHAELPCPDVVTENDRMLEEMTREEGIPRCPNCRSYVQITHGCNHMVCRCRAAFCYECSETWKRCRCETWHMHRLLDHTNRVAERQGRADIAVVRAEIVERHECTHPSWAREGAGRCDECNWESDNFLWGCRRCHLSVCTRCRFGRVQNRA